MRRIPTTTLVMLLISAVVGILLLAFFFTPTLCTRLGGKWSSTGSVYITRLCYLNDSCGHWANPRSQCHMVQTGNPRSEVYFRLGIPYQTRADTAYWIGDKANSDIITATFKNNRLISLDYQGSEP